MPDALPGRDCPHCPRLVAFREENRANWPEWYNAPVDSFGSLDATLLIVGLRGSAVVPDTPAFRTCYRPLYRMSG